MRKLLILGIVLSFSTVSFGQKKMKFVDVDQLLLEIGQAIEKDNYKKVIQKLEDIPKNDSLYCGSLTSKTYYLMQEERFDEMEAVYKEAVDLGCEEQLHEIKINRSVAFLRQEQYETSLKISEDILKSRPMDESSLKNKALALNRMGKYAESAAAYQELIRIYPLTADAHLQLGLICYKRGLSAQALMALNMYLLLSEDVNANVKILKGINTISFNVSEEPLTDFQVSEEDDDFKTINQILDQRLALEKSYDTDSKIELELVRQSHALFSYLKEHKGSAGLWSDVYAPVFSSLIQEEEFNDYIYYITQALGAYEYKSLYKRNSEDALEVGMKVANHYLDAMAHSDPELTYHYEGGRILATGKEEDGQPIGQYKFYNEAGNVISKGSFNEEHLRDGVWTIYFPDGKVKEVQNYVNGKQHGENIGYYPTGVKSFELNWEEDLANGPYQSYTESGALKIDKNLDSSKNNGNYKEYFDVGKSMLEYSATYVDDYIDGVLMEYYSDGELFQETTYADKMRNGSQKTYSIDGVLTADYYYKDDLLDGPYKTYHFNGNPEIEATSEEGHFVGKYTSYYPDGTVAIKANYNTDGEYDGLYQEFTPEGLLWYQYEYSNNKIKTFTFFDKQGNILHEDRKRGGDLAYKGYTVEGVLFVEGTYDIRDGKKGLWKYYDKETGILNFTGNYVDGLAQGAHTGFYTDGTKKSETNYKDDEPEGYSVYYHPNGKIKSQGYYKNGLEQGYWEWYYVDGTLETKTYYDAGTIINNSNNYDVVGKLASTDKYDDGTYMGEVRYDSQGNEKDKFEKPLPPGTYLKEVTNDAGRLISSYTYLNGVQNGPTARYDAQGNKTLEGTYIDGQRHGLWTWYHPNGQVSMTMNYKLGRDHGPVKGYYEDGSLSYEFENKNDSRQGAYVNYWENGQVNTEMNMLNGEIHGERKQYDPLGNLQIIRFYEHGQFVGYTYLNKEGELLEMIPIERETGVVKSYYQNGQVSRDYTIKNGELVDTYKVYSANGQPLSSTQYKFGLINGEELDYYPDGTLKSKATYLLDEQHGVESLYYENGNLKEEIHFINGSKHGAHHFYDQQGKLIKTDQYLNNELQFS